jgi:phosphoglycerate dehydrogenase-like enzyme
VALASLDCVDPEPLPAGHWLYAHPRVRVSAHISWSAPGALVELIVPFVENLRRYRAGEPLAGVVDLEQGY